MTKKKTNPHKIPISPDSYDVNAIALEASNKMLLRAWTLVFGALADFEETTTDGLLHLWHAVQDFSSTIREYEDVAEELKQIEKIAEISIPFKKISTHDVRTKGDLDKITRQIYRNALYSGFALMAEPIIKEELVKKEYIPYIFRKAYSLEQEIVNGRISMQDIHDMLLDEFSILLFSDDEGRVKLLRQEDSSKDDIIYPAV